ncbi:uncharacterized protein BDR25DRAFT_300293 [Lindgomyces ingoldianus]|uniref:Uncharacterized protein n=1 Tax=Lindgomyces ingoldianus TaxID=673940 RepID=A0ACB6RDK9_9PLEO|nr:uncharacterized protein BDR25DRAFT_300293 [Lindgomyces ingoldianus]KAF2477329.1 hypothetical protein BDR25DRAFT_300293 [Lindgomyces ingoldianus]
MTLRLSLPHLPAKHPDHARIDSAVKIDISPMKLSSTEDSKNKDDNTLTSTLSLPTPAQPAAPISGYQKFLRRYSINREHPRTLRELINAACQATCSMIMQRSMLSDGINLIVTDPHVVDLLLTCIISSNQYSKNTLNLLPGCPFPEAQVKQIVDSLPSMAAIASKRKGNSTNTFTHSVTENTLLSELEERQKQLLTWLLTSQMANLCSITASSPLTLRIPTLENMGVKTFIVTRQPGNKEALFAYHLHRSKRPSKAVFHGTHPSRLPNILAKGLKNMSGTRYQSNGRAMGRGIYLAPNANTSLCYAHETPKWMNRDPSFIPSPVQSPSTYNPSGLPLGSMFSGVGGSGYNPAYGNPTTEEICRNIRVLLGCELVGCERDMGKRGAYVIKDEGKVVVRMVFVFASNASVDWLNGITGEMERVFAGIRGIR